MRKKEHTLRAIHSGLILALFLSPARADDKAAATGLTGIQISLKLDARLTKGLYMGDRWVSLPTYVGTAAQDTVEARAEGLDAKGTPVAISPKWIPSDPEMVTVSPGEGQEVKITVKRTGESRLRVEAQGVSKELTIKAANQHNAMQVEISQPGAAETARETAATGLRSQKGMLSYALGLNMGTSTREQKFDLDSDLLMQGFKDGLSGGETLLTEHELRTVMPALESELKQRQRALRAAQMKALAQKNKNEGDAFLAKNRDQAGVVTLESGLQYKILKAGDGPKPTAADTVVCHYRGAFIDGTEFDSSYKRSQPATFPLMKVIRGWTEALQLMPAGSKWQIFIPSHLAYGEHGARSGIGPNATLIFEVELISIEGKS